MINEGGGNGSSFIINEFGKSVLFFGRVYV